MFLLGGFLIVASPVLFVEHQGGVRSGPQVVDAEGVRMVEFGELLAEDVDGQMFPLEGHS